MDIQDTQNTISNYAGFWKRFAAFIIDWFITFTGGFVIGFIFGFVYGFSIGTAEGVEFFGGILGFLASWVYYAAMESSQKQATVGKMALGIKVTDLNGNQVSSSKAGGRCFGKIISGLILGIGFIMIAFTSKKQSLHDIMVGCLVVNKNS